MNPKLLLVSIAFFLALSFAMGGVGAINYNSPVYPSTVGTILYYHFDNDTVGVGEDANIVYDYSNEGKNNATTNNTEWSPSLGFLNGSFLFNSSANTSINLGNNMNLSGGVDGNRTICFWVNTTITGTLQYILSKYPGASPEFEVTITTGNTLGVLFRNTTFNTVVQTASNTILANTWYFACITYNESNATTDIYLNGIKAAHGDAGTGNMANNKNFTIGAMTAKINWLNGTIDELIMWNRTLNAAEIVQMYYNYTSVCKNWTGDIVLTANTTLCTGTYIGSTNGNHIQINSNNIYLNCNNSIFYNTIQNATAGVGIHTNSKTGLNIYNCTFGNMTTGIWLFGGSGNTIFNNTFLNINQSPMYVRNSKGNNISYNLFLGSAGSPSTKYGAINFYVGSNNTLIYKNIINGTANYYGIAITDNSQFNVIDSNYIYNTTSFSVYNTGVNTSCNVYKNNQILYQQYTSVYADQPSMIVLNTNPFNISVINNTLYYAQHNGIDLDSNYSRIENNTIYGATHHGIDMWNGVSDNTFSGWYNTITGNSIIKSNNSGIYIRDSSRNNITNNMIIDQYADDTDFSGIAIEGNGTLVYDNWVYNNTIDNCTYGLFSGSVNTTWSANILKNIKIIDVSVGGFYNDILEFDNSTFNSNTYSKLSNVTVYYRNNRTNITFYVNNSGVTHYMFYNNFIIGTQSSTIKLISLLSLGDYGHVRWGNGTIITRVYDTYSINIPPGQYIEVGYYPAPLRPTQDRMTDALNTGVVFIVYSVIYFVAIFCLTFIFVRVDQSELDYGKLKMILGVVIGSVIVLGALPLINMLQAISYAGSVLI